MSEIVKIRVSIRTSKVGSECADTIEFEKDYWDTLTDEEKDVVMREIAFENVDWNYWEVD